MRRAIYIILVSIVLVACDTGLFQEDRHDKPADLIELSSDTIVLGSSECSEIIEFKTTGFWVAELDSNAKKWCTLNIRSGNSGDNKLVIKLSANESYDERNASLTIKCGSEKKIITITQKQLGAIITNSNKVELDFLACEFSIGVKANITVSYEITENAAEWISIKAEDNTRGFSEYIYTFTVTDNDNISLREGEIIFTGEDGTVEVVTVYQQGEVDALILKNKNCDGDFLVDSRGGIYKIEVKSNIEYEMVLPNVEWIHESSTRTISTYTHYLEIAPNTNYEYREATLIVRSKDGQLEDRLNVVQSQQNAIIIAKDMYNVTSEENLLNLIIESNVDFRVDIPVEWVSICDNNLTRSLTENIVTLKIDKNPTREKRTSVVSFRYEDIVQDITIVQNERTDIMYIEIVHSEKELYPFEYSGTLVDGTIDWGDGTTSNLSQSHTYTSTDEKIISIEAAGVDVFKINNLFSISSIVIITNDDKNGVIEDFEVEDKEWD